MSRASFLGMVLAVVAVVGFATWWLWRGGLVRSDVSEARPIAVSESAATSGPDYAARFVGDEACAECHASEAAFHARSGHARTLRAVAGTRLARGLDGREVVDPEEPDVVFGYSHDGSSLTVERSRGDESLREVIDYALGSGVYGLTFLSFRPDPKDRGRPTALEHRLSYHPDSDRFLITPGQQSSAPVSPGAERGPMGRNLGDARLRLCIGCHATLLSDVGEGRLDLDALRPNIDCERCHGPGREHVEQARAGRDDLTMPFGPDRASRYDEIEMCGQCHRMPSDVSKAEVRPENPGIVRFQPIGLLKSDCFGLGSDLRCSTCHDPHARPSRDIPRYENVCRSCHETSGKSLCPVNPRDGCVGCHMPRREANEGMWFTDHWIRAPDPVAE